MSLARWGMVIDLRKCIGCGACKETCAQFNEVPLAAQWRRVIEKRLGEDPGHRLYLSMGCMQCRHPSCVKVCPTGATQQRPDGIVVIDRDRCIGCGACILACPYRARSIAGDRHVPASGDAPRDKPVIIGICTKCDFCSQRIDSGREKNLVPGIDAEATPICVRHCIGEALYFGDLNDPESNVSILLRDNPHVQLNQGSGNDPAVYYIPLSATDSKTYEHAVHTPS